MNTRTEGILRRPVGRFLIFVLAGTVLKTMTALLLLTAAGVAQSQMTITATKVVNLSGAAVAATEACFEPSDNSGSPMSFRMADGGQGLSTKVCVPVIGGGFSISVPNVALTNPANVCLKFTVRDRNDNESLLKKGYECLQPQPGAEWCSGSICNLDNYNPKGAANVQVISGPPGPQGPAGPPGSPGGTSAGNAGDLQVNNGTGGLGAVPQSTFVRNTGNETITGAKTFQVSPEVPTTPADAGSAVSKAYVDGQVAGLTGGATNLSSPGPIGSTQPNTVNATSYSVNGVPISSAALSDGATVARTNLSNTFTQAQKMSDSVTNKTPMADIRAYGAACDGVIDDTAALQAAANGLNNNGGTIYFPGPNCYLANPTGITWRTSGSTSIQLKVRGVVKLGSTFILPSFMHIQCDGGAYGGQFNPVGPNCEFDAPPARGALGTNIVATGPQTFTPSFAGGSIANVKVGSWLTVASYMSCTISSISRDANGIVTATMSAPTCRIPAGVQLAVTGVTDTSFNITIGSLTADYPAGTMTWKQAGSVASSTGGTVSGLNEETVETVPVTAVSGSTVTATFSFTHSSTDVFGAVGVASANPQFGTMSIKGLSIQQNFGAGLYLPTSTNITIDGLNVGAQQWLSSIPVHLGGAYNFHISHSNFGTYNPLSAPGCNGTCTGATSYPFGLKLTAYDNHDGGVSNGTIDGYTTIVGGISASCNGASNCQMFGSNIENIIIEEPLSSAILVDPRLVGGISTAWTLKNVLLQDHFSPYVNSLFGYTDPNPGGQRSTLNIDNVKSSNLTSLVNKYYDGKILVNGKDDFNGSFALPRYYGKTATINDGVTTETELRGEGAAMSPSVIPYATQNVTTDPTAWTCSGTGCSITTGVLAPDGSATAGELVRGGAAARVQVFGSNFATSTGDWIIEGAWVMNGTGVITNQIQNSCPDIADYGSQDTFDGTASAGWTCGHTAVFRSSYDGDWWTPVVAARKITGSGGGSHVIQMYLENGAPASGNGIRFWNPFFMVVPYSAKPAAWSDAQWDNEIARWRQQLLHGFVPPNMPAGVLGMNPALKLYWGSDANLYRNGTNGLKTDQPFTAQKLSLTDSSCTSGTFAKGDGSGCGTPTGSSPLTTKGDLYGFSSANARIPVGSDGSTLVADSSQVLGLKWATVGDALKSEIQQQKYTYAADTGTANAYAAALTPTTAIVAGSKVSFKAANANTGASSLAVNGGSAASIVAAGNVALTAGDIRAGQIVDVEWDGTNWQCLNCNNLYTADDTTNNATLYPVISWGAGHSPKEISTTHFTANPSTGYMGAVRFVPTDSSCSSGWQKYNGTCAAIALGDLPTVLFASGAAASKPSTCTVGQMYFATDATIPGQNLYECTATNTWTQQSGGGSVNVNGSAVSNPNFNSTTPTAATATANAAFSCTGSNCVAQYSTISPLIVPLNTNPLQAGSLSNPSTYMFAFTLPLPWTLAANGAQGGCSPSLSFTSLPTVSNWVMTLYRFPAATNGNLASSGSAVNLGTVTIAGSGTSGAQTWSVTQTAFSAGDALVLVPPASLDASAANWQFSVCGWR